jgi:hypothetical protein
MRGVLRSALLLSAIAANAALNMSLEQLNLPCRTGGVFDLRRALDNSTLYEQVRAVHQRDVDNWTYSAEDRYNGTAEMRCVLVSYRTRLDSSTFVSRLLGLQLPVAVHAELCLAGHTLVESAVIAAPLIGEVTASGRYEVEQDKLRSELEIRYTLPWYISLLLSDVAHHLRAALKHKVDAVADSLCSQNSTVARITSPLHTFSANLLRRQPAKHPLRPVTLHPALEPPVFLQPTFEPFDPSLSQLSSRLTPR